MKRCTKIKLLYIEDGIVDKDMFSVLKETIQDNYPNRKINAKAVSLMGRTCGVGLEELSKAIKLADVVVFDYGGLCKAALMSGGYAAIDYWNRLFISWIRETPSKDWRCISAIDTYEEDERQELEELGVNFQW